MPAPNYTPDDRSVCYQTAGDVVAHVATRCGVDVDDLTRQRWREAAGIMREFDTYADEQCATTKEAMDALRDFSLFAPRYPSLRPDALGQATFDTMVDHTHTILRLGELIAQTADVAEYVELRKVEAYYTVRAIGAAATDYVQRQPGYPTAMWRVTGLAITANMGDSLLDARSDYNRGKTNLPPSWELYKRLAKEAARHGKPHAHTVLDREGLKLRGRMIRDRVLNRARNGVTPYSNLHVASSLLRRRAAS